MFSVVVYLVLPRLWKNQTVCSLVLIQRCITMFVVVSSKTLDKGLAYHPIIDSYSMGNADIQI